MSFHRYIYEALDYIRNHVEYVYLFQVHDDVRALQTQKVLVFKIFKKKHIEIIKT